MQHVRGFVTAASSISAFRMRCVAFLGLGCVLSLLVFFGDIPPLIESDYCYLLTAADRAVAGQGFTATIPVAPNQPWNWQRDWSFLTRWPVGYPMAVAAIRAVLGVDSVLACRWISILGCTAALIGWYTLIRRCLPAGLSAMMLSALAAACSVTTALLFNPSTDLIVVAALPWILMLLAQGVGEPSEGTPCLDSGPRISLISCAGLLSGALFWIRYASLFVPIALATYLLILAIKRRRRSLFRAFRTFSILAFAPVAFLVLLNRGLGSDASMQSQFNLGSSISFDASLEQWGNAWSHFTYFGFYHHRPEARWILSIWPFIAVAGMLAVPSWRSRALSFFSKPLVAASAVTAVILVTMLVAASALFGDKFNYVNLARYYLPIKPLYFLLFAAPLLLFPARAIRVPVCMVALVGCLWMVGLEWPRPYQRWLKADRESTRYGQWAKCFDPSADSVYDWLRENSDRELVVVSNFHEWITLETGIPAVPVPPDAATLDSWLATVCRHRGITDPEVVFVLDPDNKWRDYWIPDPEVIVSRFALRESERLVQHPSIVVAYRGSPQAHRASR